MILGPRRFSFIPKHQLPGWLKIPLFYRSSLLVRLRSPPSYSQLIHFSKMEMLGFCFCRQIRDMEHRKLSFTGFGWLQK